MSDQVLSGMTDSVLSAAARKMGTASVAPLCRHFNEESAAVCVS